MSQHEINQIASALQTFILDNFISTRYNVDEDADNYQVEQYQNVCSIIQQFHAQVPELLEALLDNWSIPIVPTIEKVGGIGHMQNIGTSASMCLQEMRKPVDQQQPIDLAVKQSVEKFLNRVKQQAQDACLKHNSASHETFNQQQCAELAGTISRELFTPYFEEYNALLVQKRKEFEQFTAAAKAELEQLSQNTKKELNQFFSDTKASADEAAKNAQTAKDTSDAIIKKLHKATKAANLATKAAKDAEETSKNMLPNMLAALGIFVGIVVAVMACYLSVLLTQSSESVITSEYYSRPFEFMQYLLMGHITLAVVFLLMYLISRISGYSLTCKCFNFDSDKSSGECTHCRNKCSILVRFKLRYPYLYCINFVCFLGYTVLALWQFINIYYRKQLDAWIFSHPWLTIIIIGLLIGFILIVVLFTFRFKKHTPKST